MDIRITLDTSKVDLLLVTLKDPDLRQPLAEAGAYQVRSTSLNFIHERSPEGIPWKALSPRTLAQKKTTTILRERGTLSLATTYQVIGSDTAKVYNPTFYGYIHNTGGDKIPERKFLGFSNRDLKEINGIFDRHMQQLINRTS